jgi:Zn-dependent protease
MDTLTDGLIWYLVFLVSTVAHEAAHAYTAYRLGDSTAYKGGQVSLNPVPHMIREPLGTIVVPIVSYILAGWMIGWASTPYDQQWALRNPRAAAKMSASGPAANLLIAIAAAFAIRIGMAVGVFTPATTVSYAHLIDSSGGAVFSMLSSFFSLFFSLNIVLCLFNLIPLPPMDGSGAIPLFLGEKAGRQYLELLQSGAFSLIGLTIAWKAFGIVYPALHLLVINLLFLGAAHYK